MVAHEHLGHVGHEVVEPVVEPRQHVDGLGQVVKSERHARVRPAAQDRHVRACVGGGGGSEFCFLEPEEGEQIMSRELDVGSLHGNCSPLKQNKNHEP